jgi:site-specific DNA-methyltransferase (adenine-specific)
MVCDKIKLYKGDCLIESDRIESGSVDLILTDLPYGTVKGLGGDIKKYERLSNSDWDNVIDTNKIMQIANRILRKNGKMILTANQPFTTELIGKAIPNVPHCYNMYWDKMHFANCLVANKAPVSYIEDILVFSKTHQLKVDNHLRDYMREERQKVKEAGYKDRDLRIMCGLSLKGGGMLGHYWGREQWTMPTEKHYTTLQETGFFKKPYSELKKDYEDYKKSFESTFNLWEGNKYKSNILKYKKDYDGHHPTQKPVLLLEDLIKTFSNENDLVVDLTMGSGSTGVACKNTNRNFIGIEQDENYFNIAQKRIKETEYKLF